ncbi:MAG: inositol monophosphatase family protein [Traorella sp.]
MLDKIELAKSVEKIAKKAGQIILDRNQIEIHEKSDIANIVTNMDVKSQKYIIEECKKLISNSSFYAEEENQQEIGNEYTWVIDPIDGTTNYAYDYKHSCISIALLYKKQGIIGVVYHPYYDDCYVGIEGIGSFCNGKKISPTSYPFSSALVLFGTSPYQKELADKTFELAKKMFLNCRDVRRSGSAALDMCYIASGKADIYYELILSPWDYAAGKIICENAKACVCALNHEEIDYSKKVGILASNKECFIEARKMLGEEDE